VSSHCCMLADFTCPRESSCNFFCCNCDFGCVGQLALARSLTLPSGVFKAVDSNGDGLLAQDEVKRHLASANASMDVEEFGKLDTNRNGFIDPVEFDKTLA
ncbi:hypothetical protein AAVH_32719, partial [Aphelenchoides avenae]